MQRSKEEPPTLTLPSTKGPLRRFVATWEGGTSLRVLDTERALVIGRGEGADIRIDHASVSRRHALLRAGQEVTLEDLGSSNGTWVDERRLAAQEVIVLRPGAVAEIGAAMAVVRAAASPEEGPHPASPGGLVAADPRMLEALEHVDVAATS